MLVRSTSDVIALVLVSACGPDVTPPVDCESPGATKLLALGDGPIESLSLSDTVRDDRGWIVVFAERGLAIECGAVPREFDTSLDLELQIIPGSGGAWLGRSSMQEAHGWEWLALDPWGESDPFPIDGQLLAMGDGVVVTGTAPPLGGGLPKLSKTNFDPDGEPTQVEVSYRLPNGELGEVMRWAPLFQHPEAVEHAFAIVERSDGSEWVGVEVDLGTGDVELLGGPAQDVYVRADARFVVIIPPSVDVLSRIVDRETDRTLPIGELGWGVGNGEFNDPTVVLAKSPDEDDQRTHVVFLPSLEEAWLEGWFETERGWVTDDGRRLLESIDGLHLIAPGQTAATPLYAGRGDACIVGDDVYLRDLNDDLRWWNRIVRIPLDGSPVRTVIDGPMGPALPLVDGRWALMRDDEDLRIHDPRTGEETVVAHGVERFLGDVRADDTRDGCTFWNEVIEPHEEVRYVARDENGELALSSYRVR